MLPNFDSCIGAIAEVVVRREMEAPTRSQIAGVARFLADVHARMPDHLRIAFRVLTVLFDASSLPLHAQPFHRLSIEARARQVDAWAKTRLPFASSFISFYVTFGTYGLSADRHGQDHDALALS